jgi:hypothetical protein
MLKFNILLVPLLGSFGVVGPSVASCDASGPPAMSSHTNDNETLLQNSQKNT